MMTTGTKFQIFVYFILIILLNYSGYSQLFSEDIVVDSFSVNVLYKKHPVINYDGQSRLSVGWIDVFTNNYVVLYRQSLNKGNSFLPRIIIKDAPIAPPDESRGVMGIYNDSYYNPLIFFYEYYFPTEYYLQISKSTDGGQTFYPLVLRRRISRPVISFLSPNDSTYFITMFNSFSPHLKVLKSYDAGNNFRDSTLIYTDSGAVGQYAIPLFKLDNGEYVGYWESQYQPSYRKGIYYSRSMDGGTTFGMKNEIVGLDISPFTLAVDVYRNYVFLAYCTAGTGYADVWLKVSTDYGYSFNTPRLINHFQGAVYFSPSPAIKFNPHVGLAIFWSNPTPLDHKIYFTHSSDFGNTFDSVSIVTSNVYHRTVNSMAVSDSGDVFILSTKESPPRLILNRAKLPVLTSIAKPAQHPNNSFIMGNYPNPFNGETTIKFTLTEDRV